MARDWRLSLTALTMSIMTLGQIGYVSGEVLSSEDSQRMNDMLDHVMKCREIPGLTMTVVKGKEFLTFARGVSDRATGEPVTAQTLFHLGSITQSFTVTLLTTILQRSGGVLHFDSPIEKMIGGEFKLSSKSLTQQMTLRDTLLHRTGLAAGNIGVLTGLPKAMSRSEVISHLKELPEQGGFRDDFNFNKFAFTTAAYVGEKLTGSRWEDLMKIKLFGKLLMSSSTVEMDDTSRPDVSRSYVSLDDELVEVDPTILDLGPLAPAGTMYTNSEDMIKALKLFLGDPQLLSQVGLKPQDLEEIMTARLLLSPGYRLSVDRSSHVWPVPDVSVGYAMGFFRNVYRGFQVVWHVTSYHGFTSIIWLLPERNLGVFISINGQKHSEMPHVIVQALTYYLTDLLLGQSPWVEPQSACTFPEPWVKPVEFPDVDFSPKQADFALSDYGGTFSSSLLGHAVIRPSSTNSKALSFSMSGVTGDLLPEGGNVFRLFIDGAHKYMTRPTKNKHPIPLVRLFFEFKGPECISVKIPDSIFGGAPVTFTRVPGTKEEL